MNEEQGWRLLQSSLPRMTDVAVERLAYIPIFGEPFIS